MGVACGPGFPLQVLAFAARDPYTRCGLYTAILNAAPAQHPLKYILYVIKIFSWDFLLVTLNDVILAIIT
jgi:hypothetical protein